MIARLLPLIGTGVLIAIVTLLGIKAAAVSQLKPLRPEVPSVIAAAINPAQITHTTRRPDVYYAAITERPVFDPSRRPYVPEAVAVEPVDKPVEEVTQITDLPPPEVTLQGIITRDDQTAALIGIKGETPIWIAQGEPVAGWTLKNIGNDWIEISRDARNIRVDMYK